MVTSEQSTQSSPLHAILERLHGSEPALARQMAADERADIRSMPAEIREVELPFTARSYYVLVAQAIAEGRPLTEAELEGVRARGTQRALEGFPLHLFVHNWQRGGTVLWQAAVDAAQPGEEEGLVQFATSLFSILDQAISAGAEAFAAARAAVDTHDRGDAGVVARLLLDGQDATAVAHERSVSLAARYDVVALDIDSTDDEVTEGVAASDVAGRRKLLRIATALQRAGLGNVLTVLDPDSGHVLVPREASEDDAADEERCRRVIDTIAGAAAAAVTATAAGAASHADLPRAAADADEMLRVARASGLGPGFHRVEDLAVQIQASRAGIARDHLLAVLDRLDRHREIIETIDRLLAVDGDRGRAARALKVHPNTINNRLAKARDLLGFDPTSTHGMVTLYAALAARRVADG